MSRRRAHLLKATADARSRWPALVLVFAASAVAAALAAGGLLAMTSVESSFVSTTEALRTPQLWVQGRAGTLAETRGAIDHLQGIESTVLIPQARGAVRAGASELPAGLRRLELPRPLAEHLVLSAGQWPEPNSPGVVLERGAARSLGIQTLPASVVLAGPRGDRELVVAAIARDVSQAAYPLSTPALAYLPSAMWDELVGGSGEVALLGVTVVRGSALRPVAVAIADALPKDAERAIYASRWVVDGLAPVTIALAGFMLLFGVVALLATGMYLIGATTAEVLQRSREVGILQATGWSRADIASVLRLPRLFSVTLGSIAGALIGVGIAAWATGQLVDEMGLEPHLDGWIWLPVIVVVVYLIARIGIAVGLRNVIAPTPGLALAGGMRPLPGGLARALQRLPLPLPGRLGATLLLSRPRVLVVSSVVLVLGLATTMFAGIAVATVERFSSDPQVWGYNYDWQVRPLDPADPSIGSALADLVGSSRVEAVYISKLLLLDSNTRVDIKFTRPNSEAVRAGILSGAPPVDDTDVLVGAGAARAYDLHPGSTIDGRIEGQAVHLRVTGIYRELDSLGMWFMGREGLYRGVRSNPPVAYYVVRLPDAASATKVRADLEARTEGRAVVTDVKAAIDFPFREPLRRVLFGLAGALLVLAAVLLLSTLLVVAAEHAYAIAIMRAVGASSGQIVGVVLAGAAVFILPALVIGTVLGVFGSVALLGALSGQIGGIDVVVSAPLLGGLLVVAVLPPILGFLAPPLLTLRRAPLAGLRAEH